MISGDHTAVIGLYGICPSLFHNFVEGRRFALSLCALAYLVCDSGSRWEASRKIRVIATVVLWMALPLLSGSSGPLSFAACWRCGALAARVSLR